MPRDTPPTLISYTEIPYSTQTSSGGTVSSAVISWQAGDLIVFLAGTEGQATETLGAPTATGLTFTQRQSRAAASGPAAAAYTAVAASSGSSAVTAGPGGGVTNVMWGFSVWVWRGSDGVGTTWCPVGSTALTTTQTPTDTHSAFCWGVWDWNAATPTGVGVPTPTHTDESALEGSGRWSAYVFDLTDRASAASQAFGISAYTGAGPLVQVGVEVLGTTSATPPTRTAGFPVTVDGPPGSGNAVNATVTPVNAGDLIICTGRLFGASLPAFVGMSGGNVSAWITEEVLTDTTVQVVAWLAWAVATAAGPMTISANFSGPVAGLNAEVVVDSFTAGLGPTTGWHKRVSGQLKGDTATFAPLAPSLTYSALPGVGLNSLYYGFILTSQQATAGGSASYTWFQDPSHFDQTVFRGGLVDATAYQPSEATVNSGTYDSLAAIFYVGTPPYAEGPASAGLAGMFDPMLNPLGAF